MGVSEIMSRMIAASEGNQHDINHFLKVYAYAKTIGELEGLEAEAQLVLEIAAITHDIACPLCRRKYGRADGKAQEREGVPLVREFLKDAGLTEPQLQRVAWLVGHHHTLEDVEGLDHQILLEADYLVNAEESGASARKIRQAKHTLFRTKAGAALLESVYGLSAPQAAAFE